MEREDIDNLFVPIDEAGQDRVVELAKLCVDSIRFYAYVATAAKECAALDIAGVRMVILTSMQMALDWREQWEKSQV